MNWEERYFHESRPLEPWYGWPLLAAGSGLAAALFVLRDGPTGLVGLFLVLGALAVGFWTFRVTTDVGDRGVSVALWPTGRVTRYVPVDEFRGYEVVERDDGGAVIRIERRDGRTDRIRTRRADELVAALDELLDREA